VYENDMYKYQEGWKMISNMMVPALIPFWNRFSFYSFNGPAPTSLKILRLAEPQYQLKPTFTSNT
jgi:hypothetical protein